MDNYMSSSINLEQFLKFIYNPTAIKYAFCHLRKKKYVIYPPSILRDLPHVQIKKLTNRVSKYWCGIENLYVFF